MSHQLILVVDFGGQYNELIARRVRACGVYCEVVRYTTPLKKILERNPIGLIFTGGPNSVIAPNAPSIDPAVYAAGVPILGICYGFQRMVHDLGGRVSHAITGEYGKTETFYDKSCDLFSDVPANGISWMSHADMVTALPADFTAIAHTKNCPLAAFASPGRHLYGVQFHPEVAHTAHGTDMLRAFLYKICGATGDWDMGSFIDAAVQDIRQRAGDKKVLLALSGGVDSSVCAALLSKAIGENLTCIFVDHGFLRKDEGDDVERAFRNRPVRFVRVNAGGKFFECLRGVTDPEQKRHLIGEQFIRTFEAQSKKLGTFDILAQGTIYPDVIESGRGDAAVIKSHHNVGGLPEHVDFQAILEPLRFLFKDEVRQLGQELGLPERLAWRQPFPGPGLAIRILGEVTPKRVLLLQDADAIWREEIAKAGLRREISQYFAVLTSIRSVGVMGDARTYDHTIALRAVTTDDFMTADFARIPYDVLGRAAARIVGEVPGVNRVVYDITTKPPGTIEWE